MDQKYLIPLTSTTPISTTPSICTSLAGAADGLPSASGCTPEPNARFLSTMHLQRYLR